MTFKHDKPFVTEAQIKLMAQQAANWTFQYLIGNTSVDRLLAIEVAKDAGDAFAARLDLGFRERGVEIRK